MIRVGRLVALLISISCFSQAQDAHAPITNADIISMTKSGIGDQTIVLSIRQSSDNFDTSPQALILLKKEGVTDLVLNEMLAASKSEVHQASAESTTPAGQALIQKAFDAMGSREKLTSYHGSRQSSRKAEPEKRELSSGSEFRFRQINFG